MDLWKSISYLGVTDDSDFRLARRIVWSNRLGLVIAIVNLFFLGAFLFRPHTTLVPIFGMLIVAGTIWFFNAIERTRLARLITCLVPAVGLFLLNISQKFGDPKDISILLYATPRMIMVGSVVLPFAMFIPSERRHVIGAVTFIILLCFAFDPIHTWFGVDPQSLGLNMNGYGIIQEDAVVLMIIVLAAAGFMFSIGNRYDQQTQVLLKDALEKNTALKKNEDELRKTLEELEVSRSKDEERNWVAKGVATLSAILQGTEKGTNLYDQWLSTLIKEMNLNQGGLFVVAEAQDGTKSLVLAASYAYERKKFLEKTFDIGEGLLGQAFQEGELLYLKQIPKAYLQITSGLGEAPPRVLVVMPVKTNQGTVAVLELASFRELEPHHLELLEKVSESLASFIMNDTINQRTKKLLDQAQTMSEELRANEEEMRQNLEELTATQEAMSRKEREYQQRIADLETALTDSRKVFSEN